MALTRSVLFFALEAILLLTVLTQMKTQVSAQFGLSVPCNNCLVGQIATLPTCVGVNLTDPASQATPQYRTCLCDSSFDFTWTNACSTNCQANELTTFKNNFANTLLAGLNLTCVKPTPTTTTTTAAPKPSSGALSSLITTTQQTAVFGWAVVLSTVVAMLSVL